MSLLLFTAQFSVRGLSVICYKAAWIGIKEYHETTCAVDINFDISTNKPLSFK
jgi:hypothetical protein